MALTRMFARNFRVVAKVTNQFDLAFDTDLLSQPDLLRGVGTEKAVQHIVSNLEARLKNWIGFAH